MNIDSLRVFCEVARQRSFSRAAQTLNVTQSAISQTIQALEKELGRQLVDRSRRPPKLTPAGEKFHAGCRDVLDRLDRTIARLRELDNEVSGPVHVASIYSVGLYHGDAVRRFMETYPKAHIRLQTLRPNLVLDAVQRGDAMLGLVSYPKETRQLAVTPWKEETMVLVCPPLHRLATSKKVRLEDLQGEDFIAFDSDLTIRKRIDAALQQHKVTVNVVMEFDNIETVKQAIQNGTGVSILPEATVAASVKAGVLATVGFAKSELVRPLGIVHHKSKPLTLAATKFIELLAGGGPDSKPRRRGPKKAD